MTATATAAAAAARLSTHFSTDPTDPSRWDALWQTSFTPWDRGRPNPALDDLLSSRHPCLNPPVIAPKESDDGSNGGVDPAHQRIRRPRALVPGCGRGYDVFLLAGYGFDAFGVEVSARAVGEAREEMRRVMVGGGSGGEGEVGGADGKYTRTREEKVGRGEARVFQGDFWEDEWWRESSREVKERGFGGKEGFDLIYDYTFFCALPPQLRSRWAARMAELLHPQGRLICLEFPTYKDPKAGGPPWAVRPVEYVAYLSRPGEEVDYDEKGFVKGVDEESPSLNEKGLVRLAHFQPARTHDIGKGTDWISIWKHQGA